MPTYDFRCSSCNAEFEKQLRIVQREEPISQPCPECSASGTVDQMIMAPAFGDPIRMGIKRPDAGWNDVLSKVKSAHPLGKQSGKFSPSAGR